ncbi:aminotransferase [Sorangium cellulosum]|uniref:Aminotransferase n=1 Tax=Sorangium cellulosum TaxID=56 RepID=A0A4P2Q6N0_SORCE|nr:aminotransferase class I/II-fold pyridoxal phosphate-dependent enzyme [Sorangium cellulosum]AUX25090.1 aminotransferase [Sorangium cellulosum]
MTELRSLSPDALASLTRELEARYAAFEARGLKLDMTRGKPSSEQLDLANGMLGLPGASDLIASDGSDTRNYGGLDGLPEMKAIFAALLEVPAAQVIVGGNSSLTMMHDAVVRALLHGVPDGGGPWAKQPKVKFLCPSPGYDRHFAICEHHGIEMITVDLKDDGPDMEQVERLVAEDQAIKGMWCVPKYSNPTGTTYAAEVVRRLAGMKTAAADFRLFWDNAYAVHDLYAEGDRLADIVSACQAAGNPNRPLVFASTSKISFAGSGVSAMASSPANVADAKKHLGIQTIGPDKVNQLRHVRFFKDHEGLLRHMQRHAELLRPKFEAVTSIFERELGGKGIATWTSPRGGYFISLDTLDGCAKEVVRLANKAGVKLTGAGATYPYGRDPRDRNIRIAPSLPPLDQIRVAMEVVAVCVLLASARKLAG